jgi:hypothetical protein
MTLQWVEQRGVAGPPIWTAQGQGRHYTVSERPGFDELPAFRDLPEFRRWQIIVTADDGSSDLVGLSATVDEAKRRAEDHEQQHSAEA